MVQDRLESWKDIAAYLKRDITTVQRWERREGMPVHRHVHDRRGSVYAFRAELDAWMGSREQIRDDEDPQQREMVAWRPPALSGVALWALLTVLVVGALSVAAFTLVKRAGSPGPNIKSLAVLPLRNLSADSGQEYFAAGITEAIIGRVADINGLRVISHTSVMQVKLAQQSVPEIAKTLGVDAVVEGSVIRDGDRVRITAQLIKADSDEHLWSATFDRQIQDVLALQNDIAHAIAQRIEMTLGRSDRDAIARLRPVAPEAFERYLKGRFALGKNTRVGFEESIGHLHAAISRDPSFAPAYSALAMAYCAFSRVFIGAPPLEARPEAIKAATKALELDPDLAEAHVALAETLLANWEWEKAEIEYRRAIELNPNHAAAYVGFGQWLLYQGRTDDAIRWTKRGRELDPLALFGTDLGWTLFQARRYDEAIRELRMALDIHPDEPFAMWMLGFVLIEAGQPEKAVEVLERTASLSDRSAAVLGVLVRAYAHAGRRDDARKAVEELTARRASGYVPAGAFVNAYLGLGDHERAFMWLERAYDERSNILRFLKVHSVFDPLRNDPRFADLVRRVAFVDPGSTH